MVTRNLVLLLILRIPQFHLKDPLHRHICPTHFLHFQHPYAIISLQLVPVSTQGQKAQVHLVKPMIVLPLEMLVSGITMIAHLSLHQCLSQLDPKPKTLIVRIHLLSELILWNMLLLIILNQTQGSMTNTLILRNRVGDNWLLNDLHRQN